MWNCQTLLVQIKKSNLTYELKTILRIETYILDSLEKTWYFIQNLQRKCSCEIKTCQRNCYPTGIKINYIDVFLDNVL